ncbi:MAG: PKD domain-containing protein, partial [FCB group bacterium]|nr:PKD domain-containing protein [FCB group bacterium]
NDRSDLLNKMGLMLPTRRKSKNGKEEPAPGGENQPPTAEFGFAGDGLTVTFTGTGTDADGNIVSYAWDFGDGNNSMERNPVHTYETAGTYSVSLTVADDGGETGTSSQTVPV